MYAKLFRYMLRLACPCNNYTILGPGHTAYNMLSVITTLISLGINILPYYKPRRLLFRHG